MNYIYIHFDPRTMAARYVGRSSSPVYRYYQHSNSANKIGEWFNQLHKLGLVPLMKIVDEVETEEEAVEREAYWIRFCEKHGAKLLNFQRQHHIQLTMISMKSFSLQNAKRHCLTQRLP